jgi:serine/threonine-protein kinase
VEHREVPIDLLVAAVLDGRSVDWDSAESSASSEDEREEIRHYRTLAAIAALHREPEATHTQIPVATTELWGSLRLLEQVGAGSFGEVYRAWDTKLDREVALKLLRHRGAARELSEARALEEGRLLARVRHPNVVTVFGADRIGDRVGIWMDFIRGRSLQQILAAQGPLSAREATTIGIDLCLALSAVHRAGLIHRDLKAHNVMREDGGRIVLMDFGAGREDLDDRPAELAGTPLYLAPEVFAGTPATARSDIYGLGVLLYYLVTASYPVKGRTVAELREAHARRQRSWLRDERPDLPERFVHAIERALERDPDMRYESAGAMEASLARAVGASESMPVTAVPPGQSAPIPINQLIRRVPRFVSLAGAALTTVAVVGALVMLRSWRVRDLASEDGPRPGRVPTALGSVPSWVVRKVIFPEAGLQGKPSADGRLFSGTDRAGNLVVIELKTGKTRRLTTDAVISDEGNQHAESSAISADDRFVAYTWYALDGKYELRIIDMEGKHPRVLLRSDAVDYALPLEWSRDGLSILSVLTSPDLSVRLALVSTADGTVRLIKDLGRFAPQYASLSPDSRFAVYDAPQSASVSARDIFIIGSDGSGERRLVAHPANDVDPVWTLDGRVLFASDRSGAVDLWSVGVEAGFARDEPQIVHRNIGHTRLHGLTDTGSYFFELTVGAVDVYDADFAGGGVKNPRIVPTTFSGSNLGSVWSPDGRRLAYSSRRGLPFTRGSTTLVIRDVEKREEREITPAMNSFLPRSWLPDGRHILTTGVNPSGRWGNYQADVDTGRFTPIVVSERSSRDEEIGFGESMPDGRILYYHGGRHAFVARNLQTGAEEQLLDLRSEGVDLKGGSYKFAQDGQTLGFTAFTHMGDTWTSSISFKVLGGGPRRDLASAKAPVTVLFQDWSPDGQSILFTRDEPGNGQRSLWRVSIHGGDPERLGLSMEGLRDVRVRPDGTKLTFTAGWPRKELWVIENVLGP